MIGAVTRRDNTPKKSSPRKKKFISRTSIFIILMLLYPIVQFAIMWFGVNTNSILLTFHNTEGQFYSANDLFYNYVTVFQELGTKGTQEMLGASFAYVILNCFITLPISLFFSYFIFKKIYAATTNYIPVLE